MPESWEKVSMASAFLLVVNSVNPASAFRHQGQSGTAGHGLVRHRPAIVDRQCGNKVKAKQSDRLQVDSSRLRDRKV